MPDVLFIKTSSLGDVIHHMPALTEARARRPDARFAWVVEEAFAPLVRLHPALDLAIPVAARAWRLAPHRPATWRNMASFRHALRAQPFDEIVDTQGLFFKSALIARYAQGRRHGYDANSIKERAASWLYDGRHRVEWNQHAVARNRALTAQALGYVPQGPPDFGLDRARLAGPAAAPYGVLLHATARRAHRVGDAARTCPGTRAARPRGAIDCWRLFCRRRRHRALAFGRGAWRAAGGGVFSHRAGADRPGRRWPNRGAGRHGRAAIGCGGIGRGQAYWNVISRQRDIEPPSSVA